MARHGARQVAIAALAIIGGVGIGAQDPQPAPTFRSEIDYVQIPVRGLTQSDFQVLEDGRPQTITAFSAVDIPFVRHDSAVPTAPRTAVEGVASVETLQVDGRVYVFVLDNQTMDDATALKVRQLMRRFIRDRLAANDLAAIVLTGIGRGQSFTYDGRLLDAARWMGAVKGRRKALVLLTALHVCSIEISECRESLDHALRVGLESDVSIYAIDGRGLSAYERTMAEHANPNSTYGDSGYAEVASAAAARSAFGAARREFHGASSGARYLAEASGGFAVVNTNSVNEGFTRVVRENSLYYLLAYYSTNSRTDGKLRMHRITTSRRGLRVVHRSGYLAPASSSGVDGTPAASGPA